MTANDIIKYDVINYGRDFHQQKKRDGISINVNCIKTTLITVNIELEISVEKLSNSQNAHFRNIEQIQE